MSRALRSERDGVVREGGPVVHALRRLVSLALAAACAGSVEEKASVRDADTVGAEARCETAEPPTAPGSRRIVVYFACTGGTPGQLYAVPRIARDSSAPIDAALGALLSGPTDAERARGFTSFLGSHTANTLRSVRFDAGTGTLSVDFDGFTTRVADEPGARSFLPPGVMAEITWTIFSQFPEVRAVRFSEDGSERAFWTWLGAEPEVFTREDWERI